MGWGGKEQIPDPEAEAVPVEQQAMSTAQEAVPVPYFAGERLIALAWITPPYNQRTQEAPDERPSGKK